MSKIPLFKICYGKEEEEAVAEVMRSGWTGLGQITEKFEEEFAKYVGAKYAVAVNSCTAALQLSFRTLKSYMSSYGVIVPTITFCSTAHAALAEGHAVSFSDVYPDTLMSGAEEIRKLRDESSGMVAFAPVLYAGQTPDPEWEELGIPLIYDCAHACGAQFSAAGKTCCWSFHSVKNLSCGDGGMITTDSKSMADKYRELRWLGITRSTYQRAKGGVYQWYYDVPELGYKYHMNDITASLGLVQLRKMPTMQENRRKMASLYYELLGEISRNNRGSMTQIAYDPKGSQHLIVILAKNRDRLSDFLAGKGITTGVHYKPIHLHSCYGFSGKLPHAENMWTSILSLPMFSEITEENVREVCDAIQSFYS